QVAYNPLLSGGAIQPGQFRDRVYSFRLPEGVSGAGNIEIRVTADLNQNGIGSLFETNPAGTAETNNQTITTRTSIAKQYADLTTTAVVPSTGVAGAPLSVTWTVTNVGPAATPTAWSDRVILSRNTFLGDGDDVLLGTVRHTGQLATNANYTQTSSFTLPSLIEGNFSVFVRADNDSEVLEPDTRANNTSSARPITLSTPYADLLVEAVGAPTAAQGGDTFDITWRVRNTGTMATNAVLWNDRIVLSTDQTFSAGDLVLAESVAHGGSLAAGDNYVGRATVTLPRDLQGNFYVLVKTDTAGAVFEGGRTANNAGASPAQIVVALAPMPDLRVTNVSGPTQVVPGDSVTVTYTSTNAGGATARGPWRDTVYLDTGTGLVQVATVDVTADLAAGASIGRSVTFNITAVSEGDFHFVVKTDVNDQVYERAAENNNQTAAAATVNIAKPDLVVTQVTGPATANSGDIIHVAWQVTNNGNRASGQWTDRLILSRDGTTVDAVLATVTRNGPVEANASYNAFADVELPLGASGAYFFVVATNFNDG